jgi:hypothetical protein
MHESPHHPLFAGYSFLSGLPMAAGAMARLQVRDKARIAIGNEVSVDNLSVAAGRKVPPKAGKMTKTEAVRRLWK